MKLRNPLFAPADAERKMRKALASDADAVILDLEDSVALSAKVAARAAVVAMLAACDRSRTIVRVNASDTEWHAGDLDTVVAAAPAAILLPKCVGVADLNRVAAAIDAREAAAGLPVGALKLLALVTETATSVQALDYTGATPRLIGLCFGAEDISAELGVEPRDGAGAYPAPIVAARAAMLIAAAAAQVPAIDTPFPDPRDPEGLGREARAAAVDGFVGKLCIHPNQLEAVQNAFTPSSERLAWARMIRAAFAAAPHAGVLSIDGKMIDRPHLRMAERILAAVDE